MVPKFLLLPLYLLMEHKQTDKGWRKTLEIVQL